MASANEKRAAELGISLKQYKASSEYKKKKEKEEKEQAKKDEKKAKSSTKKYYEEKKDYSEEQNKLDTEKLKQDLDNIYKDAGIAQTRAIEDYNTNIGNITANKTLEVSTLNDYLSVNTTRTQEDLDTGLAKEERRYTLEADQINQNLADSGFTFSDRTSEKVAKETAELNKQDIQTEAARSFQDIARYEAAKTAELELKYGQQTESNETTKTRTLETIANEQAKAIQANKLGVQGTSLAFKEKLSDLDYSKSDTLSEISNYYTEQTNKLSNVNKAEDAIGGV